FSSSVLWRPSVSSLVASTDLWRIAKTLRRKYPMSRTTTKRTVYCLLLAGLILGGLQASSVGWQQAGGFPAQRISLRKIVLDTKFRSEGAAVADINKDGKLDIIVGDFWYEAPDWKIHPIRKSTSPNGFDPAHYSNCMICFVDDFNKDGWPDVGVIGFPGAACH